MIDVRESGCLIFLYETVFVLLNPIGVQHMEPT